MATAADSFISAFGAGRGLSTPVTESERLSLYQMEAASAFKAHRDYESGPLRVATSTQPFSSGHKHFAFLIDNGTGRLLAVSQHPSRESRDRVRGIPAELASMCDLPRRYVQPESLAVGPAMRAALIEVGLYTREELLLEMLHLEDRAFRFLVAVKPRGAAQTVKAIRQRAGLTAAIDFGAAVALHEAGLITYPYSATGPLDEQAVRLTDDGRFLRHHMVVVNGRG